jgi:hypothetical protein
MCVILSTVHGHAAQPPAAIAFPANSEQSVSPG